ncbi:hypothetical protein LN042_10290 [Kitasatospora sp. RB6PN24]|uniref:hypothetical protein n=1 Tax=Kitasatospora humi TaxID=2893891 RepID=UPI001E31A395|nr:hypothetical protein [Kitasatospora humi]MCC9307487.1 hypothetical protein [Kitasatospora humi]
MDAVYFVLGQAGREFEFHAGPPPDGSVRSLPLEALRQAIGRRRALLDQVMPRPELDTAAVTVAETRPGVPPGRRLRAVLAAADGQLAPSQLAARLGRSVFGLLLDVRLLAAAGHLVLPHRPLSEPPPAPSEPLGPVSDPHRPPPEPHRAPSEPPPPSAAAPSDRSPAVPSDPEVTMLLRIRAALEARL